MSLLEFNAHWMGYNITLAIIAVVCGWLSLKIKRLGHKIPFLILWLLFIPNTLYLLSDSIHFSKQLSQIANDDKINLFIQYVILMLFGIVSFIIGIYPIESLIKKARIVGKSLRTTLFISLLQFVIAFGIVMGRVRRTHSWEIFFDPQKVIHDGLTVLTSFQLMLFVVLVGIIANIVYFSLKPIILYYVVRK